MPTSKKNVSKEHIVETALELIDKNGIKDVTLREIAKKLGCAHTNLYNYFGNMDELYWESLGKVLLKLMEYTSKDINNEMDPEERLISILSKIIDFSIEHPGWYKLIWFETLKGRPPQAVAKILSRPSIELSQLVIQVGKGKLDQQKSNLVSNILFRYLHGELCIWINDRSFEKSRKKMKENTISNLKVLIRVLINEGDSNYEGKNSIYT